MTLPYLYLLCSLILDEILRLKQILLWVYEMTHKVIFFNFFIETHYY